MFVRGIRWLYEASINFDKYENSRFFSTLVVFLVVLVIVRLIQIFRELKSLPPGPWGLPIFGYLPFLKTEAHIHFGELAKKYGSLFSTRLGNQLIVVVSDHKAIREAFRREEFTGRPHTEFSNILGGYGESLKNDFSFRVRFSRRGSSTVRVLPLENLAKMEI